MGASLQRHYKLRSSNFLTFFVLSACLLLVGTLFLLPLAPVLQVAFGLIVLIAGAITLLMDARLAMASSCIAFRLEVDGNISLILRDGRHLAGRLCAGGVILPIVVLIDVCLEQGGHRSLVLLADSLDTDSFRRLRVVLRWKSKQQDPISSV